MYVHLSEKFPARCKEITSLARSHEVLRAIVDDYEELITWLKAHETTESRSSDEFQQAQTLARELESEMLHQLEKYHDSNN